MISGLVAFPYGTRAEELATFGDAWRGPERMNNCEPTLVATYYAEPGGQDVDVYCTAMPARFYELRVRPADAKDGYSIQTGSGCTKWAAHTAKLIAAGMIAIEVTQD